MPISYISCPCSLCVFVPFLVYVFVHDLILKSNWSLKVSRNDLVQLFIFATAETHFIFDGAMYDKINGVAVANMFLTHHENGWIKNYTAVF